MLKGLLPLFAQQKIGESSHPATESQSRFAGEEAEKGDQKIEEIINEIVLEGLAKSSDTHSLNLILRLRRDNRDLKERFFAALRMTELRK